MSMARRGFVNSYASSCATCRSSAPGAARARSLSTRMRWRPSRTCLCRRVLGAKHVMADLTLDIGEVAYDYLAVNTKSPEHPKGQIMIAARIKSRS